MLFYRWIFRLFCRLFKALPQRSLIHFKNILILLSTKSQIASYQQIFNNYKKYFMKYRFFCRLPLPCYLHLYLLHVPPMMVQLTLKTLLPLHSTIYVLRQEQVKWMLWDQLSCNRCFCRLHYTGGSILWWNESRFLKPGKKTTPKSKGRPRIQFPYSVTTEDGTIVEITSTEDLKHWLPVAKLKELVMALATVLVTVLATVLAMPLVSRSTSLWP